MNKMTDIYSRVIETYNIISEYVEAYEMMIMESYSDGDHNEFMKHRSVCEELLSDVESIVKSVEG